MTPTFHTSGNAKHYATPSYRHQSTLGGAFETAGIVARIGMLPAAGLAAFLAVPITLIIMFGDKL